MKSFDQQNRFIIRDYQSKPAFSSFLPGIAGELGIPIWCFYNNRGQAVSSFGVSDKDHAIMEFTPAHVAYRDVSRSGFRTLCKINGIYQELFTQKADMHIGMSELEITCNQNDLSASVVYFGLPEERTAALCRILTLVNTSDSIMDLELLDGMSAVVPYGLNNDFLKNMTQLSKAWMQCEDHEKGLAYFRVRASLEDGAVVREVKGGNFCLGYTEDGTLLKPIVQPSLVFGQDTSLCDAKNFRSVSLDQLMCTPQVTSNQFLCCFLPRHIRLDAGQEIRIFSLYGQVENKETLSHLTSRIQTIAWFAQKRSRAKKLTDTLTAPICCKTGNPVFDAYAKQTYLDNLLRGGASIYFQDGDKRVPFHIYSRKHGDPEREYNYFSLGQEYYAQGNGNYRDVNQNRRCDVLFSPDIEDANIHDFFDLIQTDGYNPLVILPSTYSLSTEKQKLYASEYPKIAHVIQNGFTPGTLAMAAEDSGMDRDAIVRFVSQVICDSNWEVNANFGEGYWCDHWTYNLDLIESYLTVYPERKDALLFTDNTCRWYDTKVLVNPRVKRYCITKNGLRQYYALDESAKQSTKKWMQTTDGKEARSALIEKLLLLAAIKTATLDASGMGIEMEGGRPGWYDALNGLPGLLGSSIAETCELARLLDFTAAALSEHPGTIEIYEEIQLLIQAVCDILSDHTDSFRRWDAMNQYKEQYRIHTMYGYEGKRVSCSCTELFQKCRQMEYAIRSGIEKAAGFGNGLIPTYFTFEAISVSYTEDGPIPTVLKSTPLPLFLEGPVRYMKLPFSQSRKRELVKSVKASGLYDRKLKMYKVNESLQGVSYEAGRALAFTPGWLENESVWLHMEYKYLLELLKNGLYEAFSEAFYDTAVPFLNPEQYGRSPLENVSFIASSANPDSAIHGQGFVARLSGSTAEFIHMWQILFFGNTPFFLKDGRLHLQFTPFIPTYLMPKDGILKATFLGRISVVYHADKLSHLQPEITAVQRYTLTYQDGHTETIVQSVLTSKYAFAIRNGEVTQIDVYME